MRRLSNDAVFPETAELMRARLRTLVTGGTSRPAPVNLGSDRLPFDAYRCPELGRTCQRPGAYDAFDLPSVFGRELRYPDGRSMPLPPTTQE